MGTVSWSILDGAAHRQHALDNDGRLDVEVLAPLTGGVVDRVQHPGRACRLDEDATVNLIGGAAGHEHEAAGAGLDAGRVEVG